MGNEINMIIDNLCDKLGIAVENAAQLIPEFARMKIAEVLSTTIIMILWAIAGSVIVSFGWRGFKRWRATNPSWPDNMPGTTLTQFIVGGLLLFTGVLVLTLVIPELVKWMVAPTAKTCEYILSMLG